MMLILMMNREFYASVDASVGLSVCFLEIFVSAA